MRAFSAKIAIIGVNPYVTLPDRQLKALFGAAGRERSPIPIEIAIGTAKFKQNLVRYQGAFRLYLNTPMRKAAGKQVGDRITLSVAFDPKPRTTKMPKLLAQGLAQDPRARATFAALTPSRRKEIKRYLGALKTEASVARNTEIVLRKLRGERSGKSLIVLRGVERAVQARSR